MFRVSQNLSRGFLAIKIFYCALLTIPSTGKYTLENFTSHEIGNMKHGFLLIFPFSYAKCVKMPHLYVSCLLSCTHDQVVFNREKGCKKWYLHQCCSCFVVGFVFGFATDQSFQKNENQIIQIWKNAVSLI